MKSKILKFMALFLLVLMVLCACAPVVEPDGDDDSTEAPSTEKTEGQTTEVATTEEETIEETTTEEVVTKEPEAEDKKVKNILMLGNSFCYYYVEELYGIAKADGYDLIIANLYASGASLEQQWNNYQNNESFFEFYVTNTRRKRVTKVDTVRKALAYASEELGEDWDVITLQGNSYNALIGNAQRDLEVNLPYAKQLFSCIKESYPKADLYWHSTWSYEIGYGSEKSVTERVTSVEKRTSMYEIKMSTSYSIVEETGVKTVPTGDAWEIARRNALIGTTLCARTGINNNLGDYYHDGDIGGGQYLNACVWYEVLMGESCVGNTWRPQYDLSEEKIAILQAAAHEAVAAVYGADHAK